MIRQPPRSPPFPYPTLFRSTTLRALLDSRYPHGKLHVVVVTREEEERAPHPLMEAPTAELVRRFRAELPPWQQKRSEEHTSELQSQSNLVCRLLLEKKKHAT